MNIRTELPSFESDGCLTIKEEQPKMNAPENYSSPNDLNRMEIKAAIQSNCRPVQWTAVQSAAQATSRLTFNIDKAENDFRNPRSMSIR